MESPLVAPSRCCGPRLEAPATVAIGAVRTAGCRVVRGDVRCPDHARLVGPGTATGRGAPHRCPARDSPRQRAPGAAAGCCCGNRRRCCQLGLAGGRVLDRPTHADRRLLRDCGTRVPPAGRRDAGGHAIDDGSIDTVAGGCVDVGVGGVGLVGCAVDPGGFYGQWFDGQQFRGHTAAGSTTPLSASARQS